MESGRACLASIRPRFSTTPRFAWNGQLLWFRQLPCSRDIFLNRWKAALVVMVLCCGHVAAGLQDVSTPCPDHCVCLPALADVGLSYATSTRSLDSVNCSAQGLLHLDLLQLAAVKPNAFSSNNSVAGNQSVHVTTMMSFLDASHNLLGSARPLLAADDDDGVNSSAARIGVRHLDLSHNQMSRLSASDTSLYVGVQTADFSFNALQAVEEDAFRDCETLHVLVLSHNQLSDIPLNTFHPLVNLRTLDLSFNHLSVFIFKRLQVLSSLETVYLQHNTIIPVPGFAPFHFPPLSRLTSLNLSSNPIQNTIPDMFAHLPRLTHLDLSNCSIMQLDQIFLRPLDKLQELTLDHNKLSAIPPAVFHKTSLRSLSLAHLPALVNISYDTFKGLSHLVYLNLSHNPHVTFLHPHLLYPLKHLEVIDLSASGLTNISPVTFQYSEGLRHVFLKENPLICSCTNAWLGKESEANSTKFVDVSSLSCLKLDGTIANMANAEFPCSGLNIRDMTTEVKTPIGSRLLIQCSYDPENNTEAAIITWTLPGGRKLYYHHYHDKANSHLLTSSDVAPNSLYHRGHYWHNSRSYYPELRSLESRVILLSDGSLYIDYMLRSDAGPYQCAVTNAHYNQSVTIQLYLTYKLSGEIKIYGIIVGLLCALAFFTLNVIYVIISWAARRVVNKRRREIIRQMLESLNAYKTAQIARIHENYTFQLGRVRNQYHVQRDRLTKNYTQQVAKMKRGCSNQVEKVRDNYNSRLAQLRDYSSNQIMQIRERTNNQIVRIRDYGATQLEKLRETYKLQQLHVIKLLDTMNLENCRNVVETECMRTESMIFDIDILGDDVRTDSPTSPDESDYNTAASSPDSSPENVGKAAGFRHDMSEQQKHHEELGHEGREYSSSCDDQGGIIVEMQTTVNFEAGLALDVTESWKHRDDPELAYSNRQYRMNVYNPGGESLVQLRSNAPHGIQDGDTSMGLEEDESEADFYLSEKRKKRKSRGGRGKEERWRPTYMIPEASPIKQFFVEDSSQYETDQAEHPDTEEGESITQNVMMTESKI